MPSVTTETSEMAILRRIVNPEEPFLSAEAAQAILRLDFHTDDRTRMNQLAAKNRAAKLTPTEEQELNSYIRVGQTLGILQSKARRSLRAAGRSKTSYLRHCAPTGRGRRAPGARPGECPG